MPNKIIIGILFTCIVRGGRPQRPPSQLLRKIHKSSSVAFFGTLFDDPIAILTNALIVFLLLARQLERRSAIGLLRLD